MCRQWSEQASSGGTPRLSTWSISGEHALDLGPALDAQQNFATRRYAWDGGDGFTLVAGAQDVDPRHERAVVARGPTDEGKHAARCEPEGAASAIEDLFVRDAAEPDPALDLAFEVQQLHAGAGQDGGHGTLPSSGNSRSSSARSMSATV